jgi:hypothetical protein
MLAADAFMFQNPLNALDVNNDAFVSTHDALVIIDQLNGASPLDARQFVDTSGDDAFSPIDALKVIYDINNRDELPLTLSDRVQILADRIGDFPQQVAAHWTDVAANVTHAMDQHRQVNDSLRIQLDEFLAFETDNEDALRNRLEEISQTKQAMDVYLETQVSILAENIASIDAGDGNVVFDFYDDFDWSTVDNPEAVMDQLMEEIEIVGGSIELPSAGELDPAVEQLVEMFEQEGIDAVEQDQATSAVEEWYLNEGDIGDLLDSLDDGAQQASSDFGDLVDQYFGDEDVFVEYIEEVADDLVIGDLIAFQVIGGEGEGDIPYVVTDGTETWQLVIGGDAELQSLIESYAGQSVLVDGNPITTLDSVLDVSSIVRVEDLSNLASDLAWVDVRLANILLGLLD